MSGSPENYKGQYASLKFDPYKFKEFPKAIYVDGKVIGTANNLMEEKELYASRGIDKGDIDPLRASQDEVAELRAKLAQFEAGQPATGRSTAPRTNTVEMLPAGSQKMGPGDDVAGDNVIPEHLEDSPRGANPTYNPPPDGDPARNAVPKPGAPPNQAANALQAQATAVPGGSQQSTSAAAKLNPLLPPKPAGSPGAVGTAPQVTSPIKDGQ